MGDRDPLRRRAGAVHVLGSLNVDHTVRVPRHPAIGETVSGAVMPATPGGKGLNQAVAAARAGRSAQIEVRLNGRVGDDEAGRWLVDVARSEGIAVDGIAVDPTRPTGSARIVVADDGTNTVIVDPGANATTTWTSAPPGLVAGDVAVAQLEVPHDAVASFLASARHRGAIGVLNPSPAAGAASLLEAADVLVLNEHELAELAGVAPAPSSDDLAGMESAAAAIRSSSAQTLVVTVGAAGVVTVGPAGTDVVAGEPARAVDTTGAGDCFLGVLAASLAAGTGLVAAVGRANRAAARSVERPGTVSAMPTALEIDR